jgi:hypothetical protein
VRFRDASSEYCGEEHPVPLYYEGHDGHGNRVKVRLDRWCYPQPPGHEGPHRDIGGRGWV